MYLAAFGPSKLGLTCYGKNKLYKRATLELIDQEKDITGVLSTLYPGPDLWIAEWAMKKGLPLVLFLPCKELSPQLSSKERALCNRLQKYTKHVHYLDREDIHEELEIRHLFYNTKCINEFFEKIDLWDTKKQTQAYQRLFDALVLDGGKFLMFGITGGEYHKRVRQFIFHHLPLIPSTILKKFYISHKSLRSLDILSDDDIPF
jgi:hypothetical protein